MDGDRVSKKITFCNSFGCGEVLLELPLAGGTLIKDGNISFVLPGKCIIGRRTNYNRILVNCNTSSKVVVGSVLTIVELYPFL